MNYDSMSVHELLMELTYESEELGVNTYVKPDYRKDLPAIESALRKAVIREASVGSIGIRLPVDEYPVIDGLTLTRKDRPYEWHAYDLISKETHD